VEARFLTRAYLRYGPGISDAVRMGNIDLAREIYEATVRLPSLTTAAALLSLDGLQLDGPLFDGSSLTYCFRGLVVLVLKSLDENEAERAEALQEALRTNEQSWDHVVDFELKSHCNKRFMLMPKFEATLEQMTWLCESDSMMLWSHVSSGLRCLHNLGFSHADVKSANVGLRNSTFFLIDLGSVSRFGNVTSCTNAYIPRDFFGKQPARASAALDWWMLGLTLAEKCCRNQAECLQLGCSAHSPTKKDLLKYLQLHLPTTLWEAFSAVIEADVFLDL
jgi:serine/threonine protein kinase